MALHTICEGQGEPVVLVHSSGMSGRQWRRLAEALRPTHRVYAPDLIGSGENAPLGADARTDWHADVNELVALVDTLPERVHLVGHSYGGLLALTVARQRPARLRSLAVYDPVAFGVLYAAGDRIGLDDLAAVGDAAFSDEAMAGHEPWLARFVDYWNGTGAWRALPETQRQGFLRVGRKIFYEVTTLATDRTPGEAYCVIDAPSLLLGGERSPPAAQRVLVQLAKHLPNARVAIVPGAGHMGPLTHSDTVNQWLVDHIVDTMAGR